MTLNLIALAGLLMFGTIAAALPEAKPTKLQLITRKAFSIQVLKDGKDITKISNAKSIKYNADGTLTRTNLDGTTVQATWRFLDEAQTQLETKSAERTARWEIIELTKKVYRKRSLDDKSIEIIQTPVN